MIKTDNAVKNGANGVKALCRMLLGRNSFLLAGSITWCLLIVGCASKDAVEQHSTKLEFILEKELVFENLLTPAMMDLDTEGNFYIIDSKEKQVKVYAPDGRLLRAIGRAGDGPGEFISPKSLDVSGQQFIVGDMRGRMTRFGLDGAYISSFVVPEIRHINSGIRLLDDSLVVIGGLVLGENYFDGTLLHRYSQEGIHQQSFGLLSQTAKSMESVAVSGAFFDFEPDMKTFWVMQSTEYTLYHYNLEGELLDSLHLQPPYFRPLMVKEPESSDDYKAWMAGWDRPIGVFSVNDSMLAVKVQLGQPGESRNMRVDVIRKKDGYLYDSFETAEKLAYVNAQGQFFFSLPTTEEPVARYRVYHLAAVPVDANLNGEKP